MAAAGIGNPAGFVALTDGGTPRFLTGKARANISGGVFVFGSTATGVVSSGLDSFVSADIIFAGDASGALFNGIAVKDTGSNNYITVATKGLMLLVANGNIDSGVSVTSDGNNAVLAAVETTAKAPVAWGRTVTAAASGGYVVVDVGAA